MRGGLRGAGKLAAGKLDFGQPVEDQAQAAVPDFALDGGPIVEAGRIAQRKSGQKIAALGRRQAYPPSLIARQPIRLQRVVIRM